MPKVVATLLVAAVALASSCQPDAKTTGTEVVFWQFTPAERIAPLLARFESENPGLMVRMEQLTWDSGQEKIAAAVASGTVPDLCELGSTWMPRFIASGALTDWSAGTADLRATMRGWELAQSGDAIHGLPWVLGTRVLFYNKTLFARAKLDTTRPPVTWDELYAAAAKIQKLGGGVHGYGVQSNEQYRLFKKFMPFAWGNGGDVLDASMSKAIFDSHENLEALEFYLKLAKVGLVDRQDALDREFKEGRLGLQISGGWLFRQIPKDAPGLRYGVALVPRPGADYGTHASFGGGEVLVSFNASKQKEAALRLARFLVRPDNALALAEASMDVLPAASGVDTAAFYRDHPDQQIMLQQMATAHFTPNHPAWGDMEKAIEDEVEQALYGRKSAAQALQDAQATIAALLEKR